MSYSPTCTKHLYTYEPGHSISYNFTPASREGLYQPLHFAQSDQSLRWTHEDGLSPELSTECTAKTLIIKRGCAG